MTHVYSSWSSIKTTFFKIAGIHAITPKHNKISYISLEFRTPLSNRHHLSTTLIAQNHARSSRVQRYYAKNNGIPLPGSMRSTDFLPSKNPELTAQDRRLLDQEFEHFFFRKPKVLIVGIDTSSMIAALTLHKYGVNPDVLDTSHYMHPLSPTKDRCMLISSSAYKFLRLLNIDQTFHNLASSIKYYSRSEATGDPIGSVNFQSLEVIHRFPTQGIQLAEMEAMLQALVSKISPIQTHCVVENLQRIPDPITANASTSQLPQYNSPSSPLHTLTNRVKATWSRYFLGQKKQSTEIYDVVIISEGTFSPTRDIVYSNRFLLQGLCHHWELCIPRPKSIPIGFSSDQWGWGRRAGFFPIGNPKQDRIYVYGQSRIPYEKTRDMPVQSFVSTQALLEQFQDFKGPWQNISSELVGKQCTSTVVLKGLLNEANDHVEEDGQDSSKTLAHDSNWNPGDPIVCIGPSNCTLPIPNLGHDLGFAIESGYLVASGIIYRGKPIPVALAIYRERVEAYRLMSEAILNEIQMSVVWKSRLPPFIYKWMAKRRYTDKILTNREMNFLGFLTDAANQEIATTENSIDEMKSAWHSMSPNEREKIKMNVLKNESELFESYCKHVQQQSEKQSRVLS